MIFLFTVGEDGDVVVKPLTAKSRIVAVKWLSNERESISESHAVTNPNVPNNVRC